MHSAEKEYKSTINRLGLTLLMFWLLIEILLRPVSQLQYNWMVNGAGVGLYILSDLLVSAAYLLSFLLPIPFFYLISGKKRTQSPFWSIRFPTTQRNGYSILPIILSGIAIIWVAAYLNALLVSIFDYSSFSSEALWSFAIEHDYDIVLLFVSTALVPAVCEELLFRGLILTNLLPYGKKTAVLGSALLFALMHENIEQVLYAFVAGIVLGLLYIKTKSIWLPTLLHFFNNFSSVVQITLSERFEEQTATGLVALLNLTVLFLGVVSIIYLAIKQGLLFRKRHVAYQEGCYGQPPHSVIRIVDSARIEKAKKIKWFLLSPILPYLILTTTVMITLLIYALKG